MLAHLIDDYDPEAHRRLARRPPRLFREIVRRAAAQQEARLIARRKAVSHSGSFDIKTPADFLDRWSCRNTTTS